ncbi:MAG TPA: hypothetical protein VJQ52_07665 [Steroidobacteraceae bacterium]|nr:hypothetical protein [Steroidobacteraceae bacterium]
MSSRISTIAVLLVGTLLLTGHASADCAGDNVQDKKRLYESALAFERAGKKEDALRKFRAAEGYACEPNNPYENDAAKRAAPLGLELGAAAEQRGDLRRAFEAYEDGGHYALADRLFMQMMRAEQDSTSTYQIALEHYRNREGAFYTNNAAALRAVPGYKVDPKYMAEVLAMPAKGVERALERERTAWQEQYLREYVQLIQSRPDDVLDTDAMQRFAAAQSSFAKKWGEIDPAKTSRRALEDVRQWGMTGSDENLHKSAQARFETLVEQRATTLRTAFHGAPELLENAMDYYRLRSDDPAQLEGKLRAIRSQALQLANVANDKQRYLLASEYYDVAGESAKASAARSKQQQLAMQKMQPAIDQAQRQAEEMRKQFDPATVEAMRKQAEAARQSMQQQQQDAKKRNQKSADELEKELGL